ncbi:MAG: manganese efflux pump [Clostridia bacterium]|jgi:putative Mn2+ efflux pump MntP|nr:manganese efflux pump [Clostridia bacterium]MEE0808582.1 manganese efflux pump MntP family protein [Acutalibacteraceae bacterium]
MGFAELLIIAVGLAMDAFAVSVCKGLKMQKINIGQALTVALFFGAAQGIMPAIGWLLGVNFEKYIVEIDHWIAFALLAFLGGKMIYEAFKSDDDVCACFDFKELFMLAIATSIDALAVGITFAFLSVSIVSSVLIIAIVTFICCLLGVFIGHVFGATFKNKAEFFGGTILVLMGFKILLEHLDIINF